MTAQLKLTDWDIATLRCAGRAGKTFRAACREIGSHTVTVRRALRRQGLVWDLKDVFPALWADPEDEIRGYRKLAAADIERFPLRVPDSPQAKALTMAWRVAA